MATYCLLAHKEWNSSQHRCKNINTTNTATYILSTYKEWNSSQHRCKDTNTATYIL